MISSIYPMYFSEVADLPDPASIIMEGILIFNKHLLFLLTVIVLFVG